MRRYRLLRNTPTAAAGTICETIGFEGHIITDPYGVEYDVAKIDEFDEWFKEIKETAWEPKKGDEYWYFNSEGMILCSRWLDSNMDSAKYDTGNCYRTKEDCEHAKRVQIARATIKRSSDFEPDWNDGNQPKWYVAYDHCLKKLDAMCVHTIDNGAIARYETEEYAKQAIKDLEPEYLLHFGVEKGAI